MAKRKNTPKKISEGESHEKNHLLHDFGHAVPEHPVFFCLRKKISFEFEYAGEQGYILTRAEVPRTETTLVIPDTYRGLPVYYIDHNAFYYKAFFTIDVGKNTKVIASGAFYHCHPDTLNLRNVTEIQEEAFRYHYLQELVIPATVETIETWAFASSLVNSTDVYFLGDPAILEIVCGARRKNRAALAKNRPRPKKDVRAAIFFRTRAKIPGGRAFARGSGFPRGAEARPSPPLPAAALRSGKTPQA